jgi:Family of unknown function (DUF6159)
MLFLNRISYTWHAMGSSWAVLKRNKKLLLFPLFSGMACIAILISFAIPIFLADAWMPPARNAEPVQQVVYYGTLFLFYFCNYFVITFFNSAVVGAAVQELSGHAPTFGSSMKSATNRLPQILGWSLVSATVGLVLRVIEDKSDWIGQIVVGLLGAAWTMTTFLVVPVLVVEGKGPIEAFKTSASLLRQTWGEQLMGNFGFGIIFFLLAIPAIIVLVLGFAVGGAVGGIVAVALAVVYLIVLSLIQSTLQGIFQAVLYLYAARGETPDEFDRSMLRGAMTAQ